MSRMIKYVYQSTICLETVYVKMLNCKGVGYFVVNLVNEPQNKL